MKTLGYFAQNSNGDLLQYELGQDNTFYLKTADGLVVADKNDYTIIQVGD